MKRILVIVVSFIFILSVQAGGIAESAVPAEVKAYIAINYSKAKNIEWDYEKKNNSYEAEFYIDGREIDLEIAANGVLLKSKEDMLIKDIPDFAVSYIKKNYSDAEILGAHKRVDGSSVSYSVGIVSLSTGSTKHRNIVFDSKGNVVKK